MRLFSSFTQRRLDPARLIFSNSMSRSRRWRKDNGSRAEKRAAATKAYDQKMQGEKGNENESAGEEKEDYTSWSQEKLIERVTLLENELKTKNLRYD